MNAISKKPILSSSLGQLGFLRLGLLGLALANTALRPTPGSSIAKSGWEMIPTLVAPAAAPIFLMVILFDVMMSRIRAADAQGEERRKYQLISYVELAVVAIMVAYWLPYFLAIGQ